MTTDGLDDIVIDMKCDEAATINNQGRDAQVYYILGLGEDQPQSVWVALINWQPEEPGDVFLELHRTRRGCYVGMRDAILDNSMADDDMADPFSELEGRDLEYAVQDYLEKRGYYFTVEEVALGD